MPRNKQSGEQMWPLAKLKKHPQQTTIFGDLKGPEFEAFVADLEKKGQQTPVEILPDGTIITGHQRVRAARRLEWKEIRVVLRHDLAEAGPLAVEEHFVSDNLRRRHLSPLARARCIQRLMEIQTGDRPRGVGAPQKEQLKAEIGAQLGISLRSVNRYLLVLETPHAVQAAFDRGDLILTVAGRVALLDKPAQRSIAQSIEAGEPAAEVVAEAFTRPESAESEASRAYRRLLGTLRKELPKLDGQIAHLDPLRLQRSMETIQQARALLREVAEAAQKCVSPQ